MPFYQPIRALLRIIMPVLMILSIAACEYLPSWLSEWEVEKTEPGPAVRLSFAVASYVGWMPWLLAQEEGAFKPYLNSHQVDVQFISDTYPNTLQKFTNKEVDAIAITNIDAIAYLVVTRTIESDVVLITNHSNGNESILVRTNGDTNILGKTFGMLDSFTFSYLLSRYLLRQQINEDSVKTVTLAEAELNNALTNQDIYGLVAGNPYTQQLLSKGQVKSVFNSRDIPNEIIDMIVVRREVLQKNPKFANILLTVWFSMMERLQGNRQGPTRDSMARLAGLSREEFDKQLGMTTLNDTPTKALSAIRNRNMQKTIRHIRYFLERHNLKTDLPLSKWVSYPGRQPQILHFNAKPLQEYITPRETGLD